MKNVSAEARGWEEFQSKFPYLGHELRRNWSEGRLGRQWLKGMDVEAQYVVMEERRRKNASAQKKCEVEEWLRGGGGQE